VYQSILWNPDVDPDAILDEYCATLFGPAAKEMREYFGLLIDRWENVTWSYTPDVIIHGGAHLGKTFPAKLYWTETYPTDVRAKLQTLLGSALAKTKPGTIYHDRMVHQTGAAAEFFEMGAAADSGNEVAADCPFAKLPIEIDGDLVEWKSATPMILKECMTGKDAKIGTEFFTAHDAKDLYIAGRVHEPVGMILPPNKDALLYQYDSVEIFLCPGQLGDDEGGFNKRGRFFQFMLNSRGDVTTSFKELGRKGTKRVTLKFDRAVKPMGKGFQFEMRIPYASLNALTPKPGDEWPANFYRNRKRDDGSERYYGWSPTMGKPFFYARKFGVLRFPKKLLFTNDFKITTVWDKAAPTAKRSFEFKDGIGILKVKYPASARKPTRIGIYSGGLRKTITKPITVKSAIRYNGAGVTQIEFYVRSLKWEKMVYRFSPAADPKKRVQMKSWHPVSADKGVVWRKDKKLNLDKIADFYSAGVSVYMHPGAEFTLEVKPVKVYER